MTPKQVELIENTWDFVVLNTEDAGMRFYSKLFELDPNLKQLFGPDLKEQSQKLIALITFVVHKLNSLDGIMKDVRALGMRHKGYKVLPEHYSKVGTALLWTLEQSLGNSWNDEVKEAWVTVYKVLSTTMIEAAGSAEMSKA